MAKIVGKAGIEDCSNASPYFGKLLHGKRSREIVLPEVFSILFNYYQDISKDEDEFHPLTDLWKCRLVCKAWNKAIEGFLDDKDKIYFALKNDLDPEIQNIEVWVVDSFRNDSGAETFLAHFNPTHMDLETNQLTKNPFLGRCVHLFYDRDDGENVHHSFMDMLKIYGKEIWYFRLFYHFPPELADEDANRLVELYREIREMIYYMPRLRVFRIFYKEQILDDELPLDIRPSLQPTPEETLALNREIAQNPLPKFENLEFLVTTDLPTPIFNQLLYQNRKEITHLAISRKDYHQDYELFGGEELPNLKILSLEFTSAEAFELFESCPLTFKLEKFHFYYDQSAQFLLWSRVFQAFERKVDKDVCSELLLQMPLPRNDAERRLVLKETFECRLGFPNLKRILIFEEATICLDFLLPAEVSLDKIAIGYKNKGRDGAQNYQHLEEYGEFRDKQLVQFLGYKKKLDKGNMFPKFFNLKEFYIAENEAMGGSISYEWHGKEMKIERSSDF